MPVPQLEDHTLTTAYDYRGALLGAPPVAPAAPLARVDVGRELGTGDMRQRDPPARHTDVAAAHLQALHVDLEGDMDEAEREEENQESGRDAAAHGHDPRGGARGPRRVDGELDAERHDRGAAERQEPLDPVGGATGPDVGVVRGLLAVGVVPHAYEVTQVSPCGYLVAESDCSGRGLPGRPRRSAGGCGRAQEPAFRV